METINDIGSLEMLGGFFYNFPFDSPSALVGEIIKENPSEQTSTSISLFFIVIFIQLRWSLSHLILWLSGQRYENDNEKYCSWA